MKRDDSNTWLSGPEQASDYVSTADIIVVERRRTLALLGDIFGYHFGEMTGLRVLDLGGGDGFITEAIKRRFPDNEYILLDGSADMLEMARRRLEGTSVTFIQQSFEQYVETPPREQRYDCIYSSNAIHHLDFNGKSLVYSKVLRELDFGGLFLNIDVVLSATRGSERWQQNMWRDWINENLRGKGREDEVGKYDDLPQVARRKPENKPSKLVDQLWLLERIGFRDVDCFYKYGMFALFGGTK